MKKLGLSPNDLEKESNNQNLRNTMYKTRLAQKQNSRKLFSKKLNPADRAAMELFSQGKNIKVKDVTLLQLIKY